MYIIIIGSKASHKFSGLLSYGYFENFTKKNKFEKKMAQGQTILRGGENYPNKFIGPTIIIVQ